MKRWALFLATAGAAVWLSIPFQARAAGEHDHGHDHAAKEAAIVSGEVVDMGCYVSHEAKGAKHADCAAKCIAGGMPMGIVTEKGDLYLLTMDHGNPDAYNKTKEFAGKQVTVKGPMHARGGMKSINVTSVEPVETKKKS